jgi:energy-coupling factor transport system permease protein
MFGKGIGESSEFAGYHPWVNLTYYVLAVGITMFSLSPWFLAATFTLSWVYSVLLRGKSVIRMNLIFTFWTVVIMSVVNVFFTHEGVTVLFYLNDNAITLEALIYGISAAVMLISVIIWFASFNVIMTADKLIYLFGKAAPVLGLTLSMIFRYVPLLKERYAEIRMGQACMPAEDRQGFMSKLRQLGKEMGILVSWSLESSIETADSMEARGYGLRGRTSFHLYRMGPRDAVMLTVMLLLGGIVVAGVAMGKTTIRFYPEHEVPPMDVFTAIVLAAYVLLLALPIIMDIYGEVRWKQSELVG